MNSFLESNNTNESICAVKSKNSEEEFKFKNGKIIKGKHITIHENFIIVKSTDNTCCAYSLDGKNLTPQDCISIKNIKIGILFKIKSKISSKDGLYGINSYDGKVILPSVYDKINVFKNSVISENNTFKRYYLFKVSYMGKVGILNSKGKILVPIKFFDVEIKWPNICITSIYQNIKDISSDRLIIMKPYLENIKENTGRTPTGIIKKGVYIFTFEYNNAFELFEPLYSSISIMKNEYIIVSAFNLKKGIYSILERLTRPVYDSINVEKNIIICKSKSQNNPNKFIYDFINNNGNFLYSKECDSYLISGNVIYAINKKEEINEITIFTRSGELLAIDINGKLSYKNKELAVFVKNQKNKVILCINSKGKIILPNIGLEYDILKVGKETIYYMIGEKECSIVIDE